MRAGSLQVHCPCQLCPSLGTLRAFREPTYVCELTRSEEGTPSSVCQWTVMLAVPDALLLAVMPCFMGRTCTLSANGEARLQEMMEVIASNLRGFNAINLATAVNRMGKMQAAPGVLAHAMQHQAFTHLKAAISAPQAADSASVPRCCR